MVCKNCGADLKPGIKYCLECGSYIDEDDIGEEDVSEESGGEIGSIEENPSYTFETSKKKKKKLSTTDILIYSLLVLVLVVSIIVIVITLVNNSKKEKEKPVEPEVKEDSTLMIDFYKLTVPGEYLYDVQGDILYVSDDVNYTFSYRNTTDDYDAYEDDLDIVTEELESHKYEVYSSEKKLVDDTEFLCYKLRANGSVKYLYITKASSSYTSLGVIEVFDNGDWESALPVIAKLNRTLVFTKTPSKDEEEEEEETDDKTLTSAVTEEYSVTDTGGSLINAIGKED